MIAAEPQHDRIVITGIGLTAPNGNNLAEFRENLLACRSGVSRYEIRYVGETVAGICNFDELRYQKRKDVRRGTRAGSIGIYCGPGGRRRRRARLGKRRQVAGRHLRRRHRARQRRNRKRDFRAQGFRLRHQVLVAPSQPPHRGQQSGRRNFAQPGNHRPALHHRCRLCRRQRRHHSRRSDAAAGRMRLRPGRRRLRKHSHFRHFRQLQKPGGAGQPRRSDQSLASVRYATATASSWPKGAACTCWSGWPTPAHAAPKSTARSPATP